MKTAYFSPKKCAACDPAFLPRKSAGRHSVAFKHLITPPFWKAS